jgi:cell division protein FtsB
VKIGRYLVACVLAISTLITFGDRGLIDNYMMRERLAALEKSNQEIGAQNEELKRTICMLRTDLAYIEMVARNELGMVKKGDRVYRFSK